MSKRLALPSRPWCCVEPRCTAIHQLKEAADLSVAEPGESFICFGRMPEGIVFEYDGVEHANDLRSCHYTPLKGLIANQEHPGDWMLVGKAYAAALRLLEAGAGLVR